jgi:ribosomal-protein-alanine N-acetyltransferase
MLAVSLAPIETERLMLRPVDPAHAREMWPVLREPALYQWIAREPPSTLADIEARLNRISVRSAPGRDDQWLNWTVWLRASDEAIGIVESTVPPSHVVQIAYMFAPRVWRQGYASEAVRAVLATLEAAGAVGFEATIDTRNAASRALAAKLGFRLIETRPSGDIIAGAPSLEEVWRREA